MKKVTQALSEDQILESYPIKAKSKNWYFRTVETSNNAWEIVGTDIWGRRLYLQGDDPDVLIQRAELIAKELNDEAGNA